MSPKHTTIAAALAAVVFAQGPRAADITLDPGTTHQTITGWEATCWMAEPNSAAFPHFRDTMLHMLVHDIGVTRIRLEVRSGVEHTDDNWAIWQASGGASGTPEYDTWRSLRYATVNDNADPNVIDTNGFHFSELDWTVENIVLPLKQVMAAAGESLYVNLNYVAFTGQITTGSYHHDDAAEYAEFVLATYQHLRSKYSLEIDAWEILLEPDNVTQWDGRTIARAIVACEARLSAAGFTPRFIAPSNTKMANAVTYFDQMVSEDATCLQYLEEFSYHRYRGFSDTDLQNIASRAQQHGLRTSMLEWWDNGNTYAILHTDLSMGNNSAWQERVIRGHFTVNETDPQNPVITIANNSQFVRMYYRFVRPGAQRIDASSSDNGFEPLAFVNSDGGYAVVVKANAGGSVTVNDLPAGEYGIRYCSGSSYDVALADQVVAAGGTATASIPGAGVIVFYDTDDTPVGAHPGHGRVQPAVDGRLSLRQADGHAYDLVGRTLVGASGGAVGSSPGLYVRAAGGRRVLIHE